MILSAALPLWSATLRADRRLQRVRQVNTQLTIVVEQRNEQIVPWVPVHLGLRSSGYGARVHQ